jgi:hypothetical protein
VPDARAEPVDHPWLSTGLAVAIGLGLVLVAYAVYTASDPDRYYNHFVWQADAFLQGRVAIEYPLPENAFFQDVLELYDAVGNPTGYALLPFPPMPAIVLLPFVAIWGLATDQQTVSVLLAAADVGLCWWMLGRLGISVLVRLAVTIFFGFGTVFWYAAQLGTTWFFAHVVAIGFGLLAVGVAIGADPGSVEPDETWSAEADTGWREPGADRADIGLLDRRQVLAGFLLGLAATARLPIVLGAPFLILVGGGRSVWRRTLSAAVGGIVPVALLLAYNLATSGSLLHAAYEDLYRREANGYPQLGYHPDWAIEDPRYLPGNTALMLLSTPIVSPASDPSSLGSSYDFCTEPGATRGLFDEDCPIAVPRDTGMSILLTSPAYLLALPAVVRGFRRSRLVTGATLAVLAIAIVNLMHFSQGWVQFGYRFSNDFVFFALPLVALGIGRRLGLMAALLIGASLAVNLWGVIWGGILGW